MPTHPLETDDLLLYSKSFDLETDATLEELSKLRAFDLHESEEMFSAEKLFDDSDGHVAVTSWDYALHLSIPYTSRESMNEQFSSRLGYHVYLFGVVDESIEKQFNFVYVEKHSSKVSDNVASTIY